MKSVSFLSRMTCWNAFTAARFQLTLTLGLVRVARRKHVHRVFCNVVDENLTYYLLIEIWILRCQGYICKFEWEFDLGTIFNKCFNFNSMQKHAI